jgi:uncharacterized protein YjiS (DUF1127 family)
MRYLQHIAGWFVVWRARRRQRQEFIDFLNSDHRAAADIGITRYEAQRYINELFWRGERGHRHRERSEAIQRLGVSGLDCFVAYAPRNDVP